MLHGLLWLPLLVFFFGMAWAGWNEYQKVETYQQWADQFERSKYDIYAALGQRDRTLTWGLPTRKGVINLQTAPLDGVREVTLLVKGDDAFKVAVSGPIRKSEALIQLTLEDGTTPQIPFTDPDLAKQWHSFLANALAAKGTDPSAAPS